MQADLPAQRLFKFALTIWILGASFFFFEYALRVSPSVMMPELHHYFGISAGLAGALSAIFYYPYILMQIPVGMVTDHFGPRRVMTFAAILTGIACLLFVMMPSIALALIARGMMGFCAAFAFVGTLRIALNWFQPSTFVILTGITQATGMLGAAFGDAPLSAFIHATNLHIVMVTFSAIFLLLGLAMFITLKLVKAPSNTTNHTSNQPPVRVWQGLAYVIKKPAVWANCLFIGTLYGPTTVFAEAWGPSFMHVYRGFALTSASFTISLIFIGMVIGCTLFGMINRYIAAIQLMRFSAIASMILLAALIYLPGLNYFTTSALCLIYGICNAGIIPSYNRAALLIKKTYSGIVLGITNMFSILFGAIMIQIVGVVLDMLHPDTSPENLASDSFQSIFIILFICFAIAITISFCIRPNQTQSEDN